MKAKRVANGLGGILCLAIGGYACVAVGAILLGVKDRPAGLWLGLGVVFALGAFLVLLGIKFGARAISGEMPRRFMSSVSQQIWGSRVARGGYVMMALPVWRPLVDEGRLRWPSTHDVPVNVFAACMGLLMIWGGRKAAASAAKDD